MRNAKRSETVQRISTVDKIAGASFQDWMRYKNEKAGSDVYIGMNALKPGAFTRTKDDILTIRHLYVDLDQDGSASLAAIEKSNLVPAPSYALNTSPDKYQVIWKVQGIAQDEADALLHALARQFDGDRAATDSTRVLRVPGFMNKKYELDFLVTIQSRSDQTYALRDFKLRTEALDPDHRNRRTSQRKGINGSTPLSRRKSIYAWQGESQGLGCTLEGRCGSARQGDPSKKPLSGSRIRR